VIRAASESRRASRQASLGIASFPLQAEDADELGTCAEAALEEARELSGNRLQVFGAPPQESGQEEDSDLT